MADIHESSNASARNLLRLPRSPGRTSLPDDRRVPDGEFEPYADLCSGVLREARSLASIGMFGPPLARLLARGSDLLDDIDEFLVALDPLRDCDAYLRAAELHRALEEVQARLPRRLRR
jgi:hypothetical protein